MAKGYASPSAVGMSGTRDRPATRRSHKLSRIEIVPAKNGWTVTCYHDSDGGGPYKEPEKLVYKGRDDMMAGLAKYIK